MPYSLQIERAGDKPAIAQFVEHLTVDICSNQMVPGSIPGGRTFFTVCMYRSIRIGNCECSHLQADDMPAAGFQNVYERHELLCSGISNV
jgi:hypothetical protein